MTRPSCNTCHWWQPEEIGGLPVQRIGGQRQVCIFFPVHEHTSPMHRCGQWRPLYVERVPAPRPAMED